ncbi:unnamed protein product [Meganyctiphanes norvegica]|uniref:chymotrypsin n=1 Tax=Meganyctiphanes norvegica TaxID=48144 RepID=A0AAV2RM12_MEGNR
MLLLLLISAACLDSSSASGAVWSKRNEVASRAAICPSDGLFCVDCLNSVFCNGGTAMEFPCSEGEVCAGDPGFAGCRNYIGEDAGKCDCDSVGNSGFLTDPYDPTKYVICVPPEAQYFAACTDGQIFNDETELCENLPPAPQCTEVGFQTNDPTCKTYYICTSTSLPGIMISCGEGLAFDTTTNTCVDECSLGPASFTCPSTGSGAFPDTADCTTFHVCSNGLVVASSIACPSGELFNSVTMACEPTSATVIATCPAINPCWSSTYCEACGSTTCDFIIPPTNDPTASTLTDTTVSTLVGDSTTTTTSTTTSRTTTDIAALDRLSCQCGQVTRADSSAHSLYNHPWTVALLNAADDKHFCSATIVNTLYVLTAASCVQGKSTSSFVIRANEHELGTKLPRAITRSPNRIQVNGDIALIRMSVPISLTQYDAVKPACLPGPNMDFTGLSATHSGYDHGKNMKNDGRLLAGTSTTRLNFVPSGHAFCREDLGGPVVSTVSGKTYLSGIAIDRTCSTSRQPVAKTSQYYNWIYNNSNTGRFCKQ